MSKIENLIKLRVAATKASPSPPVGQVLGQYGLKIMDFCKDFNNITKNIQSEILIPVKIKVYKDKTFTFKTATPSTTYLLKKKALIQRGSHQAKHDIIKKISLSSIYEIARLKQNDYQLKHIEFKNLCKNIRSTAKSMGLIIIN